MIRVNPDPHEHGYQYEPTRAVTAIFPTGRATDGVLDRLADAGFGRRGPTSSTVARASTASTRRASTTARGCGSAGS